MLHDRAVPVVSSCRLSNSVMVVTAEVGEWGPGRQGFSICAKSSGGPGCGVRTRKEGPRCPRGTRESCRVPGETEQKLPLSDGQQSRREGEGVGLRMGKT